MESKITYDNQNDVLYYNKGSRVTDSLEIGNIYVELSGKGDIAGIEILEASQTLSEMSDTDISREDLEEVSRAELKIKRQGDFAFIVFLFEFDRGVERIEERINLNLPSGAVTA